MAGTKQATEGAQGFICNTVTGGNALASIEGIDPNTLVDGAVAYARNTGGEYRWEDSSLAPASPPAVIIPLGQSESVAGRWLIISGSDSGVDSISSSSPNVVDVTPNVGAAVISTPNIVIDDVFDIFIGMGAGVALGEGTDIYENIFIGHNVGPSGTAFSVAQKNIFIGNDILSASEYFVNIYSIVIGHGALGNTPVDAHAIDAVVIGHEAAEQGNGVDLSVIIGYQAARQVVSPLGGSVFIGYQAGYAAAGNTLIGIGYQALYNGGGFSCIALGQGALQGLRPDLGSPNYNIGIGESAGRNITTGFGNVILGTLAGTGITTGTSNLILAANTNVGENLTTGYNNVMLGGFADVIGAAYQNFVVNSGGVQGGSNVVFNASPAGFGTSSYSNVKIGQLYGILPDSGLSIGNAISSVFINGSAIATDAPYQMNINGQILGFGPFLAFLPPSTTSILSQGSKSVGAVFYSPSQFGMFPLGLNTTDASMRMSVGNVDPTGSISGYPGDLFVMSTGASSGLFINVSTTPPDATWMQLMVPGAPDLLLTAVGSPTHFPSTQEGVFYVINGSPGIPNLPYFWDGRSGQQYQLEHTYATTAFGASPYATQWDGSNHQVVLVDTSSGPFTVQLPAGAAANAKVTVKDASGNAAANHLTVDGNGPNIDASATYDITTNYGYATFIYANDYGTWFRIG